jgi:hypothetical protein
MSLSAIGVGVPHRFIGEGWDPAHLVFAIVLVLLARAIGLPLRPPVLVGAVVGGLLLDLVADVLDMSAATAIAIVILPVAIVALLRFPAR